MTQQDKISILGPRDDGTHVVEFRTAAGERLAISVPSTNATAVLKHFQAATAKPYIPDGGVMTGIVKPEIRNVLRIGWTAVRGILELAIMVYVLRSMLEPADTVIVAVLGIIYATNRFGSFRCDLSDRARLDPVCPPSRSLSAGASSWPTKPKRWAR